MKIILSDKRLDASRLPDDCEVRIISYKELDSYNGNPDVVAIAGSRAMAVKC